MTYSNETSDFFRKLLLSLGFEKQPTLLFDVAIHYKCPTTNMSIYLDEDVKILPAGYIKRQVEKMVNNYGYKLKDIFEKMEQIKQEKK